MVVSATVELLSISPDSFRFQVTSTVTAVTGETALKHNAQLVVFMVVQPRYCSSLYEIETHQLVLYANQSYGFLVLAQIPTKHLQSATIVSP